MLDRIKPKKRIAFVLVAVEGLTIGEAAELFGALPNAVKQRVLHARRELIALMRNTERRALRACHASGATRRAGGCAGGRAT